jgi:hypothetical protein
VTRLDRITALARELAYANLSAGLFAVAATQGVARREGLLAPPPTPTARDLAQSWSALSDTDQQSWLVYARRIIGAMGVGAAGPAAVDAKGGG